jgi:hypothetical protein
MSSTSDYLGSNDKAASYIGAKNKLIGTPIITDAAVTSCTGPAGYEADRTNHLLWYRALKASEPNEGEVP